MESFIIAPASTRAFWVIAAVPAIILVLVCVLVGRSLIASRAARFDVSPSGLDIRGDWYGRAVPMELIRLADVRRVDFANEPDLRPRWRTFGTGVPGYQAGWFRLGSGERALPYLTDRARRGK